MSITIREGRIVPGYQIYLSDKQNFALSEKFSEAVKAGQYTSEDIRDWIRDQLLEKLGIGEAKVEGK